MKHFDEQGGMDVLQYFNLQVRQAPQRPAVICGAEQLSFLELEEQSNRCANLVRSRGVLPGEPVALLLNKDIQTLVWILAIWKVGALYVPIDPGAPPQKIKRVFEVCGMRWTVLDTRLHPHFEQVCPDVGVIDRSSYMEGSLSENFYCEPAGAEQLAYMIFTSGSTGLPKGVAISRRSLSCFVAWTRRSLGIESGMIALNIADFSFDQSVMDIAFLLGCGVSLHLYAEHKDPLSISGYLCNHGIQVISTVPTVFGLLFDEQFELGTADFQSLRKVFIGGAACPEPYVTAFHRLMPGADVYNMYGPTEVTVYCLFHAFSRSELMHGVKAVELGRPLPGHEAWLIDEDGNEVRERGELVVKGPQVMLGYWGNPGQSAEVLLTMGDGQRGYRTGDIVRLTDDGRFLFTGRKNETIKSGGYRIDLGEIEAALMSCPGVVHAAAVAIPHVLLENIIHVFVSQGARGGVDERVVREHCSRIIPDYMQPQHVHFLSTLPLNASGKIDKKHLAEQLAPA